MSRAAAPVYDKLGGWPDIDVLSDDQIASAKHVWDTFNPAGADRVSGEDIGAMLRVLGYQPTPAELSAILASRSDAGRVDYFQWLEILCKVHDGLNNVANLARCFEVFDPHKRGYVSRAEFRRIFQLLGDKPAGAETTDELIAVCASTRQPGLVCG